LTITWAESEEYYVAQDFEKRKISEIKEILGHPIQLAHVLHALPNGIGYESSNNSELLFTK
jgi:hypothetical protein